MEEIQDLKLILQCWWYCNLDLLLSCCDSQLLEFRNFLVADLNLNFIVSSGSISRNSIWFFWEKLISVAKSFFSSILSDICVFPFGGYVPFAHTLCHCHDNSVLACITIYCGPYGLRIFEFHLNWFTNHWDIDLRWCGLMFSILAC